MALRLFKCPLFFHWISAHCSLLLCKRGTSALCSLLAPQHFAEQRLTCVWCSRFWSAHGDGWYTKRGHHWEGEAFCLGDPTAPKHSSSHARFSPHTANREERFPAESCTSCQPLGTVTLIPLLSGSKKHLALLQANYESLRFSFHPQKEPTEVTWKGEEAAAAT